MDSVVWGLSWESSEPFRGFTTSKRFYNSIKILRYNLIILRYNFFSLVFFPPQVISTHNVELRLNSFRIKCLMVYQLSQLGAPLPSHPHIPPPLPVCQHFQRSSGFWCLLTLLDLTISINTSK